MEPLELVRILYQKPFRPLRVFRRDGRTYDITRENMAVVTWTTLDVEIRDPEFPAGIVGRLELIPFEEVERVEPIPAPRPSERR